MNLSRLFIKERICNVIESDLQIYGFNNNNDISGENRLLIFQKNAVINGEISLSEIEFQINDLMEITINLNVYNVSPDSGELILLSPAIRLSTLIDEIDFQNLNYWWKFNTQEELDLITNDILVKLIEYGIPFLANPIHNINRYWAKLKTQPRDIRNWELGFSNDTLSKFQTSIRNIIGREILKENFTEFIETSSDTKWLLPKYLKEIQIDQEIIQIEIEVLSRSPNYISVGLIAGNNTSNPPKKVSKSLAFFVSEDERLSGIWWSFSNIEEFDILCKDIANSIKNNMELFLRAPFSL
ncbi:MAG: hypothetical protein OEZ02_14680 [Anaerolineae bacterium]|nr:hypothetical protein [Anaerolineae bacterium]